jgi:hypothetical protein
MSHLLVKAFWSREAQWWYVSPTLKPCQAPESIQHPFAQNIDAIQSNLRRNLNALRNHRLDIEYCLQEILHDLVLALLASFLDFLYLNLCLLVCVILGLLVATGMLNLTN